MAADFSYSLFTAFGVCLIGTGLALQILYIENYQDNFDTYLPHQFASLGINTLIVCYLMFVIVFYRPSNSSVAIAGTVMLLLIGLMAEIYANQFEATPTAKVFEYLIAGVNALIRLYILISVRCDQALTTIPQLIKAVPEVAKSVGKPVTEVVRDVGAQAQDIDLNRLYGNVMSGLGSIVPEERKNDARDIVKKALGLPPRVQQGGRRR